MEGKLNEKMVLAGLILLSFFVGVMAAPGNSGGFDDYGYNEKAAMFQGCWTNYINWKLGNSPVECSEDDMLIHAKWRFDKEGSLKWVINLFYSPLSNQHVLKKYVTTIGQDECTEAGGLWLNFQKVSQTGEIVPVCQISQVISGEGADFVATPAGFGHYTG